MSIRYVCKGDICVVSCSYGGRRGGVLCLPFRLWKKWSWAAGAVTVAGRGEWMARGQQERVEHASQADNEDGPGTAKSTNCTGLSGQVRGIGLSMGRRKTNVVGLRRHRRHRRHSQGEMHKSLLRATFACCCRLAVSGDRNLPLVGT